MDENREAWIRHSDVREERERLSNALKGWWKLVRPCRAWHLYRKLRATNEASRRAGNERTLRKRLTDPALSVLNEDQRRAVIIQEDRTLIVAGAGTGKTHTMVAKARDTARTGIAPPEEIAFVTFTRKAAQEIRDRSGDLPGMEIGTLHHLARVVIMRAEGRKPRLSPLVDDETRRLTQLEAWLLEAVQEDPSLLGDLETRRQAVLRNGEAPALAVALATVAELAHRRDLRQGPRVIANSDAESVAYDFIHPRIHGGRAFRPPMSWTSSFVSVWRSVFQM